MTDIKSYPAYKQKLNDIAVFSSFPHLRGNLQKAKAAGLETLLDYQRLAMLLAALRHTSNLEGDVIEFGAFRGGSAGVMIQNLKPDKILHVCDSFEGMPDVSIEDNFHQKGDFSGTSFDKVRNGLTALGSNFEMHRGFFDQTIPQLESRKSFKISFAHIDVDLYDSIVDCLSFCYPRMAKGGIIVFDDYGAPTCLGAKKAVDEFFEDKVETVVSLSQPANGCIIGGGDAFKQLISYFNSLANLSILQNKIFIR